MCGSVPICYFAVLFLQSQGDKMNRKHLLKVRDHLVETGYIECFIKHRDKDVPSLSHSTKPKKRQSAADGEGVHVEAGLAALRLLKPFVLANSNIAQLGNDINGDDDDDDENDDDEGDDNDDDEDEGEKIAYGERDGNKNRGIQNGLNTKLIVNKYLLLAECKVRTASYGPSFFLPFMAQARRKENTRIQDGLNINKYTSY